MEVDLPHLLHEARQVINEGRNKPNEEVETSQLIVDGLSFSQLLILPLISTQLRPNDIPSRFFMFIFQPDLTVLTTASACHLVVFTLDNVRGNIQV